MNPVIYENFEFHRSFYDTREILVNEELRLERQ